MRTVTVAAGWLAVGVAAILCLTSTACSDRSPVQKDILGRLETVAAAEGPPLYFLGESYAGIDLAAIHDAGAVFVYGTCEMENDGGCIPPMQVHNHPEDLSGPVRGCRRVPDIRGVPTVSWGGGLVLFTQHSTVTIFDDGTRPGGDLRSMAEALRPVFGTADVTNPLPAPPKDLLDTIAKKCGARPGDHGVPIED